MYLEIRKRVDERIDLVFKSRPDLIPFFKKHERKEKFIENLAREVRIAELKLARRMTQSSYHLLLDSMTDQFCRVCLQHKQEQNMSAAAKMAIKEEGKALRDLEAEIKYENDDADSNRVRKSLYIPGK